MDYCTIGTALFYFALVLLSCCLLAGYVVACCFAGIWAEEKFRAPDGSGFVVALILIGTPVVLPLCYCAAYEQCHPKPAAPAEVRK